MRQDMLALSEMLQAIIGDDEIAGVVDILAQTARANADAEADPVKRHRLRWYAAQLMRLQAGPQDAPRAPRVTGAAAIHLALHRLLVRINRLRDIDTLRTAHREWLEDVSTRLTQAVERGPTEP